MNEVASSSSPARPNSASPPPKCAICLGTCTNKCYSNSCMHLFCFTCLLEWSKVKPECPLCKQPFKSIMYNIKSNQEYDEHVVPTPTRRTIDDIDDDFMFIPPTPSRHFQFRTTFTVDPGGELAIQQMLLSHPLTTNNNLFNVPGNYIIPRHRYDRPRHTRRASSATSFRRSIYMLNLWVYAPPDVTGRYRDISPQFYRENPAARNRLVPWLNRELNALLRENTQQVMHLVDVIMEHLSCWHIKSRSFRSLLRGHLTSKTDHFIHEFFNFMRSPYDMIGYDRHIMYTDYPQSPPHLISDNENDSDVAIVNISEPVAEDNNPFRRPTIEIIEINSDSSRDSDVILREPPALEVVNLVDSDSETIEEVGPRPSINSSEESDQNEGNREPQLPLKLRFKRKRQSNEKRFRKKRRCSKRHHLSTTSSSSTTSISSCSSDDNLDTSPTSTEYLHKMSRQKRKYKKLKRSYKEYKSHLTKGKSKVHSKAVFIKNDSSSENDSQSTKQKKPMFDSDDNLPLSKIKSKELKKKLKKAHHHSSSKTTHTITSKRADAVAEETDNSSLANDDQSKPSCSRWKSPDIVNSSVVKVPSKISVTPSSSPDDVTPSTSSNIFNNYSYCVMKKSPSGDMYPAPANNSSNSSLSQYDSIPHCETFQRYLPFHHNSRFNPVIGNYYSTPVTRYGPFVGNRYYGEPDCSKSSRSYTSPPVAHSSTSTHDNNSSSYTRPSRECSCRFSNSEQESSHYNSNKNDKVRRSTHAYPQLASQVHVSVGTSPIKSEVNDQNYVYYSEPGSSNSSTQRMQSVVVKKEDAGVKCLSYPKCRESSNSDN